MFDSDVGWVPESLDTTPPGYVLAAMLDDIDIDLCSGHDRVRVLQAHRRMQSHYAARAYHTMTAVVEALRDNPDEIDFAEEAAAAEVAAALCLTRRAADVEMTLALELQRRLPAVWEALCKGTIDVCRARVLVDNTLHLPISAARDVIDQVIGDAELLTTGQLGHRLHKLCIDVDPADAKNRYQHAVTDRRVVSESTSAGTANVFGVDLPPHRVAAGMKRLNQIANSLRRDGESRTMDQLRADVLLDLLEGTGPATRAARGTVDLQSDLETLTQLADHPGELAGYGPVIADIARQIADHQHQAERRWTLVDPDTRQPIDGGITRRRPTTAQRRLIQTKNRTCVHPGCRMPATDCDIDHRIPWTETHITDTQDLAPLCRHHHKIRHRGRWTYEALPDGDYQFTSHLGHTYTTSGRSP
jgi:hypothetical protein